ncbi:MAG: hypothetical protein KME42_15260 [Tildeniella nuda ZEHNDER 1965/U140]|jgi:hypothetical protein|nr:hypothetical protein [Tildeniella nuda ZEHNDER 1965/U140]
MRSIKGTVQNGVIHPTEPIEGHDGQQVVITFVEEETESPQPIDDSSWNDLMTFIDAHAVDTGIEDLAHQHDHYIHGTPKREPYP